MAAKIYTGISAWGDPDLAKAGFYPPEAKKGSDKLRYYATKFTVAELDSTYHSFATGRFVSNYIESVPEGFLFNLKAFSMFTGHPTPYKALPRSFRERYGDQIQAKASVYAHHLTAEAVDDLWAGFRATADIFRNAGKFGAVLLQFPPWFFPTPQNYAYIDEVGERLSGIPAAVEFRVGSWLDEGQQDITFQALKSRGLSLVCVDEPVGLKTSVAPVVKATSTLAVVRFHGRNASDWERKGAAPDEKYNYLYSPGELAEWVPRIQELAQESERVLVIFKNKHADYPVRNALQMKDLLQPLPVQ